MHRVLLPLDGTATSLRVLPSIRRLLAPEECSLTLLQALPSLHADLRVAAEEYLKALAAQLTAEGYPSTIAIRAAAPADAILDVAAADRSTLIAMASHGRSGLDRWVLGSVAETILQTSPIPVLLARSTSTPVDRGPLRTVLLPLADTEDSLEVLEPVLDLVRGADVRVFLLEVASPTPYPDRHPRPGTAVQRAERILHEACIPTAVEFRRGDVAQEIVACAEQHHAGLIAMTTHGRSVTAEVLRHAPAPLLALRQKPAPVKEFPAASGAAAHGPGLANVLLF